MGSLIDKYSKDELSKIIENSFSYAEVLSKLGYSTKNGNNNRTLKKRIEYFGISTEHFCYRQANTHWTDEEIFCENSKVSQNKLRQTFKDRKYVSYECAVCGLPPFWNNRPLTLTLDHINGKNKDNRLENLRWICPNCDRQSNTYGIRNKKNLQKGVILTFGNYEKSSDPQQLRKVEQKENDVDVITKNNTIDTSCSVKSNKLPRCQIKITPPLRCELKDKLWELKNYTQVANHFNVSTTQIRRWCRQYNLPATIDIIKHTSEIGWINENWNDIERQQPKSPEPPRPCYMIDKTSGLILMEFSSRREAGRYIAPKQKRAEIHIGKVCNGERKSAYGYFWENKEDVVV